MLDSGFWGTDGSRGFAVLVCGEAQVDVTVLSRLGEGEPRVVTSQEPMVTSDAIRALIIQFRLRGICDWHVVEPFGGDRSKDGARERLAGTLRRLGEQPVARRFIRLHGHLLDTETGALTAEHLVAVAS